VESKGQKVDVPAGSWVSVPMDANLEPVGTISNAKGYEPDQVDNLPIGLLGRPITVAPPIIAPPSNLCVSNPNGAWIREQPSSANQTILRVLTTGATVIDSGSTLNDGSQVWRQVETTDEQVTGWIEAASLSGCGNTISVTVTATPAVLENCTPRADWTLTYTVQPGNSLSEIARASGVSLTELAQGNCIADVNRIVAGQKLLVPKLVIILTALPPVQPLQEITPSPTATTASQISSGRWTITGYVQYVGCESAPAPQISTLVVPVDVNADASVLTVTSNGEAVNFQRVQGNVYAGTVKSLNASATLSVTVPNGGSSSADIQISVPCPTAAPPVAS